MRVYLSPLSGVTALSFLKLHMERRVLFRKMWSETKEIREE